MYILESEGKRKRKHMKKTEGMRKRVHARSGAHEKA